MRRSDHPSRPSTRICCCVSLSKTLLMPATELAFRPDVNVSIATGNGRFSAVDQWPVLGVHRGRAFVRAPPHVLITQNLQTALNLRKIVRAQESARLGDKVFSYVRHHLFIALSSLTNFARSYQRR